MELNGENLIVEIKIPIDQSAKQLQNWHFDEFIDNLERLAIHYGYDLAHWGPKQAMKDFYRKEK